MRIQLPRAPRITGSSLIRRAGVAAEPNRAPPARRGVTTSSCSASGAPDFSGSAWARTMPASGPSQLS